MSGFARIAVIGSGWWATEWHIPAVLANTNAELVALVDIDAERLDRAARYYEVKNTYSGVDDLLATERLHGVVIATNHTSHYEIARQCLDSGLHVLVEKPMVLGARKGRDLVDLARRRKLELIVGYPIHYYPFIAQLIDLFQSAELGDIQMVNFLHANHILGFLEGDDAWMPQKVQGPGAAYADPVRSGGGYGHTQITHFAGLLFHITNLKMQCVSAMMSNHGLSVDLVDAINIQFEGGALGSFCGSGNVRSEPAVRMRFEIFCERGLVEFSAYPIQCIIHRPDQKSQDLSPPADGAWSYPATEPVNNLVDVILQHGANRSPGESGWHAAELLDAAYRSAAGNGRPVCIQELYG